MTRITDHFDANNEKEFDAIASRNKWNLAVIVMLAGFMMCFAIAYDRDYDREQLSVTPERVVEVLS